MNNFKEITKQIEEARGRSPYDQEVTLIAVTKKVEMDRVNEAIRDGTLEVAENRVQDLLERFPSYEGDFKMHFIGHLQRNKVSQLLDLPIELIHGVDSLRLAKEIDKEAKKRGFVQNILVQVSVAGEKQKFGLERDELEDFFMAVSDLAHIRVEGLMMMAPFTDNPEETRPFFKITKDIFDYYKENNYNNVYMNSLSMGMTNDFGVAIEEGSTMVRIGTGLFPRRIDE